LCDSNPMFTGIILHSATLESFERLPNGARLRLRTTDPEPFVRGESLAVNGVCLTVLPQDDGALVADLSDETLARTTLGSLGVGMTVNVERALAVGDRLGGHMVQGHVDTTGALMSITTEGEFAVYRWSYPAQFAPLVVSKGSIAVDGVSLTIVEPDASSFAVALIPETLRRTNIGNSHVGDAVNLEFDMVAKYIRNLVAPYIARSA
ncbi:MAG TPA: riboflavin synthase, partial [Thermoanaerobaculia bacterium]|nr:riboflavin synthase [Thermoanaerobaculia bacterium]